MDSNLIKKMIESKSEDVHYDFKRQHHKNKADLLHDILSMANNVHNLDSYIIFGVEDTSYNIVGIESDEQRRSQQNIIDFLMNKKFAGDNRPDISTQCINIDNHELDVLIIHNSIKLPFYLSEDYVDGKKKVKANIIYTRIGDTNSPIDKGADFLSAEMIWKKRFGLLLSPIERFRILLNEKKEWNRQNEQQHYNILNPEFSIVLSDSEKGCPEFYAFVMFDYRVYYGEIKLIYSNTVLHTANTVYLDGKQFVTVIPSWAFINLDDKGREYIQYKCYLKDSLDYAIYLYLYNQENQEEININNRLKEVIIIFDTQKEKENFSMYVRGNHDTFLKYLNENKTLCENRIIGEEEPAQSVLIEELATAYSLKTMHEQFRLKIC